MKSKMKLSGPKIAMIAILVILVIIIIGFMIDYYRCKISTTPCKAAWWRPKTEPYRMAKPKRVRSTYTLRPPVAVMPPIPSTAGSNPIISPYVTRSLTGVGSKRI
jgi:hypothetical protein